MSVEMAAECNTQASLEDDDALLVGLLDAMAEGDGDVSCVDFAPGEVAVSSATNTAEAVPNTQHASPPGCGEQPKEFHPGGPLGNGVFQSAKPPPQGVPKAREVGGLQLMYSSTSTPATSNPYVDEVTGGTQHHRSPAANFRDTDSGILFMPPRAKISIQMYLRDELPIIKRQRPFRGIAAVNSMFSAASAAAPKLSVTTMGVVIQKQYSKQAPSRDGGASSFHLGAPSGGVSGRYGGGDYADQTADNILGSDAAGGDGGATSGTVKLWSMKGFANLRLPTSSNQGHNGGGGSGQTYEENKEVLTCLLVGAAFTTYFSSLTVGDVVVLVNPQPFQSRGGFSSSSTFKLPLIKASTATDFVVVGRALELGVCGYESRAAGTGQNAASGKCMTHAHSKPGAAAGTKGSCAFHAKAAASTELRNARAALTQDSCIPNPHTVAARVAAPQSHQSTFAKGKHQVPDSKHFASATYNPHLATSSAVSISNMQEDFAAKVLAIQQEQEAKRLGVRLHRHEDGGAIATGAGSKRARSLSSSSDISTSASSTSSTSCSSGDADVSKPFLVRSPMGTEAATFEMLSSPSGVGGESEGEMSPRERHRRRMEGLSHTHSPATPAPPHIDPSTALFLPKSIVSTAGDKVAIAAGAVINRGSRSNVPSVPAVAPSRSSRVEEGFLRVRSGRLVAPVDDASRKGVTQEGGNSAVAQRLHNHRIGNAQPLVGMSLAESSRTGLARSSSTAGSDITSPLARLPHGLLRGGAGQHHPAAAASPTLASLNVTPRGRLVLQAAVNKEASHARALEADAFRSRELMHHMRERVPGAAPQQATPTANPSNAELAALRAFGSSGSAGSAFKSVGGLFVSPNSARVGAGALATTLVLGEETTMSRIQRAMKGDYRTSEEVIKSQQGTVDPNRAALSLASRGLSTGGLGMGASGSTSMSIIEQARQAASRNADLVRDAAMQEQSAKMARLIRVEEAEAALNDILEVPNVKCVYCRTCESHFPNIRSVCKTNHHIYEFTTSTKRFVECGHCKRYRMPVLSDKPMPPHLIHLGCPRCKEAGFWTRCSAAPVSGQRRFESETQ